MSLQRIEVTRQIAAPAAAIFALVTDPSGQVAIDGSGMLLAAPGSKPVTGVGDTFVMQMDREPLGDLPLGRYEVLNTITAFELDRLVEWNVSMGGRSPIGHVYGYRLDSLGAVSTSVTSYCDWSGLQEKLRDKVVFPIVPVEMLERTLEQLQALVESESPTPSHTEA